MIAGNSSTIRLGNPDEVYRLCMDALTQGSRAPRGHILMPGCGIPPGVPAENLLMLKKAVADYFKEDGIV